MNPSLPALIGLAALLLGLFSVADGPADMRPPDDLNFVVDRAEALSPMTSLLVWHRDTLLVEQYFRGMRRDRTVNIKSASKSIVGLLVGIAVDEGLIDSLEQPVSVLLPEYADLLDDPGKRTITVRNLLTMQSGLQSTSSRNYGSWVASRNWVRDALRRPLECDPGSCWGYSTGSTHVLGVIIARRSGQNLRDFAADRLLGPLGVPVRSWDRDPQGNFLGGNNMAFRPIELIRLGRALLDGGRWNGRSLVSEKWLDDAWGSYARSPYNGNRYGYHWWNRTIAGERVVFAWGYGGQFLFLVPRLNLAVVVTSSLARRRERGHNERVYDLLERELIPAIRRRHPTYGPLSR